MAINVEALFFIQSEIFFTQITLIDKWTISDIFLNILKEKQLHGVQPTDGGGAGAAAEGASGPSVKQTNIFKKPCHFLLKKKRK